MKKQPPRNIYCLEGNWRTNPRCRQSVRPMLDILRDAAGIKYIYRKCNTREEFFEYLRQYTFVRYRNYTILYIAFHGRPNKIQIGRDLVTLREIADVLERHLAHPSVVVAPCAQNAQISTISCTVQKQTSSQVTARMSILFKLPHGNLCGYQNINRYCYAVHTSIICNNLFSRAYFTE